MILVGDETKHVVLFIFHALYTCMTAEDYEREKKKEKRKKWILCKYYL